MDPWGLYGATPNVGLAYEMAEKARKYAESEKERYEQHKGINESRKKFQDPKRVKDTHMKRMNYMKKMRQIEDTKKPGKRK